MDTLVVEPSTIEPLVMDKLTLLQVSHQYDVDVATLHALVGRRALPEPTWTNGRLGWSASDVRASLRKLGLQRS